MNAMQMPIIEGVGVPQDEAGRFNLNALHKASGEGANKAPNKWLRAAQTKELIAELKSQTGDSRLGQQTQTPYMAFDPLKVSHGGNASGTFAHELLAISYAGWISPAFQLKVNQVFLDFRSGRLQSPEEDEQDALPVNGRASRLRENRRIMEDVSRMMRLADNLKPNQLDVVNRATESLTGLDGLALLESAGWHRPCPTLAEQTTSEWEAAIRQWLEAEERDAFTTTDVLVGALGFVEAAITRTEQSRVGVLLKRLGYQSYRKRSPGKPGVYLYRRAVH